MGDDRAVTLQNKGGKIAGLLRADLGRIIICPGNLKGRYVYPLHLVVPKRDALLGQLLPFLGVLLGNQHRAEQGEAAHFRGQAPGDFRVKAGVVNLGGIGLQLYVFQSIPGQRRAPDSFQLFFRQVGHFPFVAFPGEERADVIGIVGVQSLAQTAVFLKIRVGGKAFEFQLRHDHRLCGGGILLHAFFLTLLVLRRKGGEVLGQKQPSGSQAQGQHQPCGHGPQGPAPKGLGRFAPGLYVLQQLGVNVVQCGEQIFGVHSKTPFSKRYLRSFSRSRESRTATLFSVMPRRRASSL